MGNNLGYRTITKLDEAGLKALNDTLRVLWDKLLGNVEYKDLGGSARKVIDSKASGEAVSELSGMYAQLETVVSQTQEEILLRATKEDLDKLQADVQVQAGQIELRVTQKQLEEGLADKLDADKPSVGVQTASAVVNEKGVYLSGGEIDMRTTDGEEFVSITDGGVLASNMSAPDVMPRYAGPTVIRVNPMATAEEMAAGATYRSLKEALEMISGRFVPYGVGVMLEDGMTEYNDIFLKNAVFPVGLTIMANYDAHAKLVGQFSVSGCSGKLTVQFLDIQTHDEVNHDGYVFRGAGLYARMEFCTIHGTGNTNSYAVLASEGANVYAAYCEMYDFGYAIRADSLSRVWGYYNKGNCRYSANAATLFASGIAPSDSAVFDCHTANGGQVFAASGMTANQGSGGTLVVPTIGKFAGNASLTRSYNGSGNGYRDDLAQGWWKGVGRIKGCMWFNNTAIRNALSGKTVLTASLRLHMNSSGRGTQVTVELAGTGTNYYDGGNPAVTREYGAIASMSPRETAEITIPVQAVNDLVSGTINGLMLYSSDTGPHKEREYSKNYAAFAGAGSGEDMAPMLTITYEQ